jgi:long-chain acyl-CoA synthetase
MTRDSAPTDEAPAGRQDPSAFLRRVLHRDEPTAAPRLALTGREAGADLTYAGLAGAVAAVARGLAADGVRPGDRVALMATYGPQWVATFLGVLSCGAVAVPLDPALGAREAAPLLADAEPTVVITGDGLSPQENNEQHVTAALRLAGIDARIQPLAVAPTAPPYLRQPRPTVARRPDDPAVIVYTSGATGAPKGVTVSWANLMYQVTVAGERMRPSAEPSLVSILPAHHLFELIAGLLVPLYLGGRVHYPGSILPADIVSAVAASQATELVVVPLFLTALRRRLEAELARTSPWKRGWLRAASHLASRMPLRLRRLVFAPLHARLGGRLRRFTVGGAPLDPALATYFAALGLGVCQGYGLSEASPTVSVNTPQRNRLGSVGLPLPGTEARIAADGEICVRGPGVMLGYWRRPDLTSEVVDADGWLRTGDLGYLDDDGYLFVTGRAKNLIVLANGQNIQPEEIETALRRSELIGDVCVLGQPGPRGEEIVAVVAPSAAAREAFASVDRDPVLTAEVRRLAADLASYKRPSRIVVHDQGLPQTSTRKVRRAELAALLARRTERAPAHG